MFLSPFWGDFGHVTHLQFRTVTKREHRDGTVFKIAIGTRCSEYSEWTLPTLHTAIWVVYDEL